MARCLKVPKAHAQAVKEQLDREGLLDRSYRFAKDGEFIYLPVSKEFPTEFPIEERSLALIPSQNRLRDVLSEQLTPEEQTHLKSAYDVVGSIAILEVDEALAHREQLIAKAVLQTQKQVRTVLKKTGGHEGDLRLQPYAFLAGEDTRITTVTENGCRLRIDVEQVYYSVRTATERRRIAELVAPGEHVLVMFSGAAPYPCVIGRLTAAGEIVGIELNKRGHDLGVENVRLNKLTNVVLINDDVRNAIPTLADSGIRFDRIIMPLPHTGHDFLDEALSVAKLGTVVHLYDFEREEEFDLAAKKAEEGARRNSCTITVLGITACGQHSPRTYRVCCDFRIDSCAARKR